MDNNVRVARSMRSGHLEADRISVDAAAVVDSNYNIVAADTRNSLVIGTDDVEESKTFDRILAPSSNVVDEELDVAFSIHSAP